MLVIGTMNAQPYTEQDSLRGMITPERAWWDLTYYHLDIKVDIEEGTVQGSNTIRYKVLTASNTMQIDLQPPMNISRIVQDDQDVMYQRNGNIFLVALKDDQVPQSIREIKIYFTGKPRIAPLPPWDSGLVWEKDSHGSPFAASVSWGAGSSQWWPCKDHMYDEVDSMQISINVQEGLMAVSNGRLIGTDQLNDKTRTYHWYVSNPINNYGVNFNIADYANFSDIYHGEKGALKCDYYVLKENLEKAKNQFKQVPMMLAAFEYWFGPYPFYEDSYKLVEVPYPGMEHQSATAYGGNYENGIPWIDTAQQGWEKKFDYLIVHESGHEWFACNITFQDIADIWIHESFTTYSEGLYVEYHYGKVAGEDYLIDARRGIINDKPMIGDYGIHDVSYSGDNYPKGAVILHMLRQVVNDDIKWRNILRGLNSEFYHQTVTTKQVEDYIALQAGLQLDAFWDQYLRTIQLPELEYFNDDHTISYRWSNCIDEFNMPLKITLDGKEKWIHPTREWKIDPVDNGKGELVIDRNFYVTAITRKP